MHTAITAIGEVGQSQDQDGEALGTEITQLCSYIYAATYRLLILIREFDEGGYWQLPGFCSCAHWLNFSCGIGLNAAREKVRVAHALARLPQISAAFQKGELSYSKVRALTRMATPDNETDLLTFARHGTAHHVEKLVTQYRRAERVQDLARTNAVHERRALSYHYDEDGALVIKARLPAEQGALIVKALEQALERQAEPADRDSAETAIEASTCTDDLPACRADALTEIAETYLNVEPTSASTADRYQVVVHVSAATLQQPDVTAETLRQGVTAETSGEVGTAYIESGGGVTATTSRRIACDCSVVGLVEDEKGMPLSIGRKSRTIPPALRRALQARDRGCRFPGCTHTQFIDGHHIEHWADGGETSLNNLVQLCRHHHRLVHEGGFHCEREAHGRLVFRDRRGKTLPATPLLPAETTEWALIDWLHSRSDGPDIRSNTCVSLWNGERVDWDWAVAALA